MPWLRTEGKRYIRGWPLLLCIVLHPLQLRLVKPFFFANKEVFSNHLAIMNKTLTHDDIAYRRIGKLRGTKVVGFDHHKHHGICNFVIFLTCSIVWYQT